MAAGAFSVVAGRPSIPLPRHSKRLGISGVRRRFYELDSALHGGGGIPGRYDGYFSPFSWAFVLSCMSRCAVSSTLHPQFIAVLQKVKLDASGCAMSSCESRYPCVW
jgi:hypothetical protein